MKMFTQNGFKMTGLIIFDHVQSIRQPVTHSAANQAAGYTAQAQPSYGTFYLTNGGCFSDQLNQKISGECAIFSDDIIP